MKGALKGIGNIPSELGEFILKGAGSKIVENLEDSAFLHDVLGNTESASELRKTASKIRQKSTSIELPKLEMSNPAQEGGNLLSNVMLLLPVRIAGTGIKAAANITETPRIASSISGGVKVRGVSVSHSTPKTLNYSPSSGVRLETTEGKTTTVLGSFKNDMSSVVTELGNIKSTDFGPRINGFNVLNMPDNLYVSPAHFWQQYNKPWLENVIARNDVILMATTPSFDTMTIKSNLSVLLRTDPDTGLRGLSGFGKEYLELRRAGYKWIDGTMRK